MHLLVHTLPKTRGDARVIYGDVELGNERRTADVINVLEVLHDRHQTRIGKWVPFDVDEQGELKEVMF